MEAANESSLLSTKITPLDMSVACKKFNLKIKYYKRQVTSYVLNGCLSQTLYY